MIFPDSDEYTSLIQSQILLPSTHNTGRLSNPSPPFTKSANEFEFV